MTDPFRPVPEGGDWHHNAITTWEMGDHAIAMGFAEAGRVVVESWVTGGPNDTLFLPVVFLYRHALELVLKESIREAAGLLRTGGDTDAQLAKAKVDEYLVKAGRGHSLQRLADRLEELLGRLQLEQLPPETHDVLRSLHELDPGGDTFRYSTVRDKQTKEFVPAPRPSAGHVDVVAMQQHFDKAFGLLSGGLLSQLSEYRDLQADLLHDNSM